MRPAEYNHRKYARWVFIDEYVQFEPTPFDRENRRVWELYPLDVSKRFALLDKYTCEDEFFVRLGRAALDKLFGSGIERLGDLIALDIRDVTDRAGLTPREAYRLTTLVANFGLSFGADTSDWLAYRATVPPEFRLLAPYDVRLPQSTRRPREI